MSCAIEGTSLTECGEREKRESTISHKRPTLRRRQIRPCVAKDDTVNHVSVMYVER